MKHLNLFVSAVFAVAVLTPAAAPAQTILDLLKTIQPGQPAPTQPAPVPTVVTNTQTIIIYSNAPAQTAAPAPISSSQPAALDTRPAFMMFVTNLVTVTNRVIVTNYVVSSKEVVTTNFYNAQGVYLQPAQPVAPTPPPGFILITPVAPAVTKVPVGPDPRVVLAGQQQAVRDLLTQSTATAGKKLSATGSFADPANQIQIPEGMTVFDRAKAARLLTAMNTAAEKAVPETTQLLQSAIARLALPQPQSLLKGAPEDAAIRLLLTTEGQNLSNPTLAIIKKTGPAAGLPDAYQNAMLKGGGLLGGLLGGGPSVDIDSHVTRGVLAALVRNITNEERLIRTTPAARTTAPLKDAFK